jgi:pullulanase/glycogen debranching enzyme
MHVDGFRFDLASALIRGKRAASGAGADHADAVFVLPRAKLFPAEPNHMFGGDRRSGTTIMRGNEASLLAVYP